MFDLDGTLVDSQRDLANAANALIAEMGGGQLTEMQVAEMVGEGAAVLVRRALAASGLSPEMPGALQRFLELYDERLLDHTRPYDGIPEALEELMPRSPLAVLTNKPSNATGRVLAGVGLRGYFGAVLGGDTAFGRKPDPSAMLHLIQEAGATPDSTMLVGDSAIDLATARRAGTRICLARYGFGFRFQPGDFRGDETFIDTPRDLPGLSTGL